MMMKSVFPHSAPLFTHATDQTAGAAVDWDAAAFAAPERWGPGLMLAGGLWLILAHGLNRYFRRRCPRCAGGGGCHS